MQWPRATHCQHSVGSMLSKTWTVIFSKLPVPVSLRKTSGLLFLVSWCLPAAQHQQMKALWMLPKTNKMHSTAAKHPIPWEMIRKSWDLSDLVRTSVSKNSTFWRYWIVQKCNNVLHTGTDKRTDFLGLTCTYSKQGLWLAGKTIGMVT